MLRIHKRTITPKALTAGIVAFTIGVAGAGAYVDRMQSFTDYENVAFDKSKDADAGVLGASSERQDTASTQGSPANAATNGGSSSQATPAMSSTSTVAGPTSNTAVQPATGSVSPTGTYLAPGMGGGSTGTTGGTGSSGDASITDTLTAPLYENTCVDTCVAPLLPSF